MKVDRSKALTRRFAGRTFYFCSEHCRNRFLASPDRFAAATAGRRAQGA
jgi:YHS domain-containing protein